MSGLSLFVCIMIFGAAVAQQAPTDGGTQGGWCAQRGGVCQSTNECDQTTNVLAGYCSEASVCCVPKRFVCEKWRSGFCTSDIAKCVSKPGHQVTGLVCSMNSVCCAPTYAPPPPVSPGVGVGVGGGFGGGSYPLGGGFGPYGSGCPGCGYGHRGWHHGGWGWGGHRGGWGGRRGWGGHW
ncbi:hypothetical protein LSAT2_001020 [Lamellibrachia satsuma]|nr:hypothetical protein LSAT2_001020 [Lamellibrachia satsuma]